MAKGHTKPWRSVVPTRGLEPPISYENQHLKLARFSLVPRRHACNGTRENRLCKRLFLQALVVRAKVMQFRAAFFGPFDDIYRCDPGRVERENPFNAYTFRYFPYRERRARFGAVIPGKDDAFKDLDPLFFLALCGFLRHDLVDADRYSWLHLSEHIGRNAARFERLV